MAAGTVKEGQDKYPFNNRERHVSRYRKELTNKDFTVLSIEAVTLALIDLMMSPLRTDADVVYFGAMGMDEPEEQKRLKEKRRVRFSL